MAESKEELKSLLDEGERGKWESWLKTQHSKTQDPIQSHHLMQREGETMETVTDFIFLGSKITADGYCSHEIERHAVWKKSYENLDSILKSRDITLTTKVHLVKAVVFFSSHIWMWELSHKEGWVLKNSCFWTLVLEKTLESPLDCMEIKLVNPKWNQPWIFIGMTDDDAEASIFDCLMQRASSLEKTLILGKTEGRKRRG